MGYASALSVVALIIMIIISYLLMRWLRPQT
jgi:ABC-type sugar transport system permease subunit